MKNIFLTVLIASTVASGTYAQKSKVVSAYNYNRAYAKSKRCSEITKGLEAINNAISHEQTSSAAKTWLYRGHLYYNILLSEDEACKAIDKEALTKCTESYIKALVLNFADAELKKLDLYNETDVVIFKAAINNAKTKMSDTYYPGSILERLKGLSGEFSNVGVVKYGSKDYKVAQENFEKAVKLERLTGGVTSVLFYNVAIAADNGKDLETAKKMYDKLIGLKYNDDSNGPSLYSSMSGIYLAEGDTAKSLEYIQNGREAYPNDANLINNELNYYLKSGKLDEALVKLNSAIVNDTANHRLYYARGLIYENLNEKDKSAVDYQKAIEINPDYFDALEDLGRYYFNKGAATVDIANKLPFNQSSKYDALKKEAKEFFNTAIPYYEKAHALRPDKSSVAEALIKLYALTGQNDKANAIKEKYK